MTCHIKTYLYFKAYKKSINIFYEILKFVDFAFRRNLSINAISSFETAVVL